jgi:hypothetical protein
MTGHRDHEARWQALKERMDEAAAHRHAARAAVRQTASATREADLRAKVNAAVREAVRQLLGSGSGPIVEAAAVGGAQLLESAADEAVRPLHELSSEEWRDTAHTYWAERPTARRRAPQTIEDLLSGSQPTA